PGQVPYQPGIRAADVSAIRHLHHGCGNPGGEVMARWSSLKDTVVVAVRNWRLWLLQFVGNAVIAPAVVGWLFIKEAYWWQISLSLLLAALLVVAALVLHGRTLNYFESAHQDRSARLLPAFRAALRHIAALVLWAFVFHFLWHLAHHLEEYS